MTKIILDYDEFKDFIEGLEDEYTKTYRGDWDWKRHTSFEVQKDHILMKNRYYSNGCKCPDDNNMKILFFELEDEITTDASHTIYDEKGEKLITYNIKKEDVLEKQFKEYDALQKAYDDGKRDKKKELIEEFVKDLKHEEITQHQLDTDDVEALYHTLTIGRTNSSIIKECFSRIAEAMCKTKKEHTELIKKWEDKNG